MTRPQSNWRHTASAKAVMDQLLQATTATTSHHAANIRPRNEQGRPASPFLAYGKISEAVWLPFSALAVAFNSAHGEVVRT